MTKATPPPTFTRTLGRPVASAIAVVVRGMEVLLVRRSQSPDAGLWGFPGGKIEPGETIESAALRELQEETGVQAKALRVFTALDAVARDPEEKTTDHYILIAVLCSWVSGTPVAADDAAAVRWFSVAELSESDVYLSLKVAEIAHQAACLIKQELQSA